MSGPLPFTAVHHHMASMHNSSPPPTVVRPDSSVSVSDSLSAWGRAPRHRVSLRRPAADREGLDDGVWGAGEQVRLRSSLLGIEGPANDHARTRSRGDSGAGV